MPIRDSTETRKKGYIYLEECSEGYYVLTEKSDLNKSSYGVESVKAPEDRGALFFIMKSTGGAPQVYFDFSSYNRGQAMQEAFRMALERARQLSSLGEQPLPIVTNARSVEVPSDGLILQRNGGVRFV